MSTNMRPAALPQLRLLGRPRAVERFPVTLVLGFQYVPLVIYPAWRNQTRPEWTIIDISTLAILTAFSIEALLAPAGWRRVPGNVVPTIRFVIFVAIAGWLAALAEALTGQGTYRTQIGTATTSNLAVLVSPFHDWPLFSVLLVLWLYRAGQVTRWLAWLWIGISSLLELGLSSYEARYAPLMAFLLAITFVAILAGLLRLRWVGIIMLTVPILWGPLYAFRNHVRIEDGGNPTSIGLHQAQSRLRLDLEFSQMEVLGHIPVQISHDSPLTLIRYGLLPRALDPGRPPVRTDSQLSLALGSVSSNSETLTVVGDVYAEYDWYGVPLLFGGVALVVAGAVRTRGPWGTSVLGLVINQALWIESTWPTLVSSFLQGIVSLGVLWVVYKCWSGGKSNIL